MFRTVKNFSFGLQPVLLNEILLEFVQSALVQKSCTRFDERVDTRLDVLQSEQVILSKWRRVCFFFSECIIGCKAMVKLPGYFIDKVLALHFYC